MRNIATITLLTFREAWRRRMVVAALGLGLVFLLLFAIGFALITDELQREQVPAMALNEGHSFLMLAALYVVHFLTVMLAIFAPVDTISGEIASHTIQSLVTKPVRRWEIVLGKWLGYAAMLVIYLGMLDGGVMLLVWLLAGFIPPNPIAGLLLLMLEALVLLSLSLLGGTRLSTLTNGVVLFMLYGLAFIGSWVEQIGSLLQSEAAVRVGIVSSLLMPVESLWRLAAYLMQSPLIRGFSASPFSSNSVPSSAMVVYAMLYTIGALALAMRAFSRRDL